MKAEKWFEINVDDSGFSVYTCEERPYLQRELARKAVVLDGKIYASNEVLSALVETQYLEGKYLQFGRRRMHQVTSRVLGEARERCAYRRAYQTEPNKAQMRNLELIAWFEAHLTNVREQLVNCLVDASTKRGDVLTQEDANWLIDNANQFSDEELGEMVGIEAAVVFKKLLTWL